MWLKCITIQPIMLQVNVICGAGSCNKLIQAFFPQVIRAALEKKSQDLLAYTGKKSSA